MVETDQEFNFVAPEEGFEPFIQIDMPASLGRSWEPDLRRTYFVRLADGRFGRIEIGLLARNGVFDVNAFVNPSGSRKLEYDEAIQPKPIVQE